MTIYPLTLFCFFEGRSLAFAALPQVLPSGAGVGPWLAAFARGVWFLLEGTWL